MKRITLIVLLIFLLTSCVTYNTVHPSRTSVTKLIIPNLDGYLTLLCDFHMHTVFSDGFVWPTVRVEEAYFEGLTAISITDHIERRIFPKYKSSSHNRSYEEALTSEKSDNIIIIRGSEISRDMPPGHINAIFLTDCDELAQENYIDVIRAAKNQNAFIFWNHPGWKKQQFKKTTTWWPEHTQLLDEGLLHGIEVANGNSYYPEAHLWCLEKKLTMIGSTDAHNRIPAFAPYHHRTMTIVFARQRSAESIYEALIERRTAVYLNNLIIGEEKYLKELFEKSIIIETEKNDNTIIITFNNNTDILFNIKIEENEQEIPNLDSNNQKIINILPQSIHTKSIKITEGITYDKAILTIENFLVGPNIKLKYTLEIK